MHLQQSHSQHDQREIILQHLEDMVNFKSQLLPETEDGMDEEEQKTNDVIRHEINVLKSAHKFISAMPVKKLIISPHG